LHNPNLNRFWLIHPYDERMDGRQHTARYALCCTVAR